MRGLPTAANRDPQTCKRAAHVSSWDPQPYARVAHVGTRGPAGHASHSHLRVRRDTGMPSPVRVRHAMTLVSLYHGDLYGAPARRPASPAARRSRSCGCPGRRRPREGGRAGDGGNDLNRTHTTQ
eukprot:365716-Chlamydomonas_euryale.AAC.7